jgi:hypothetical protein
MFNNVDEFPTKENSQILTLSGLNSKTKLIHETNQG